MGLKLPLQLETLALESRIIRDRKIIGITNSTSILFELATLQINLNRR